MKLPGFSSVGKRSAAHRGAAWLVLFLAGCSASATSPDTIPANEVATIPENEVAQNRANAFPTIGRVIPPQQAQGRLRAEVRFVHGHTEDCWDGPMELRILDGNRPIFTYTYCSEYGFGDARLVTDRRGRHYVLLTRGEGRGTHATSIYLTVYRFADDDLYERARLLVSQPVDISADQRFQHVIEVPPGGGIIISGRWHVLGETALVNPPPPDGRTEIRIDTAPASSS